VLAEQGDAKAEAKLAYMYSHGEGVPQSYSEALLWRQKSADQGNAIGERGLGYMYSHGEGVPQDYAEALRWFSKAADQGDPKAQDALAIMYEKGSGVPQDYAKALRWYVESANRGYPPAIYNLGNMYYNGYGVPQDRAHAVRLYQQAANRGDEYAQQVLHIKWKGMSTFRKVALSIAFLGSTFVLVNSLLQRGGFRGRNQLAFTLAGLLGIAYVIEDLFAFRYVGILTPVAAVCAVQFAKWLLAGTSVALMLSLVLPTNLWPKVAKAGMGVIAILLIGLNFKIVTNPALRSAIPALRSFWSLNAMFLGTLAALAMVLWLKRNEPKLDLAADSEPTASGLWPETERESGNQEAGLEGDGQDDDR